MVDEEKQRRLRLRRGDVARPEPGVCRRSTCRFEVVAVRPGELERVPSNPALTPQQHATATLGLQSALPGGTIPERAHSSERLRPGRAGRRLAEPRREKLPAESRDNSFSRKGTPTPHVDHTHQIHDPGPHLDHHLRARGAVRQPRLRCSAGSAGLILFAGIAIVFNLAMFWFSDKLALKASQARPVSQSEAPELYRDIEEIAGKAGCRCRAST